MQKLFSSINRRALQAFSHPLATNTSQLIGARYLSALLGMVTTVFAARLLGPGGYGTVALAVAYPSLLSSILGTRSESVTIRYAAAFRAQGRLTEFLGICKVGYAMDVVLATIVSCVVVATAGWFSKSIYDRPDLAWLMMIYAGAFPFASLASTSSAILSAHREFRRLAIINAMHPVINLIAVVGLLGIGLGVPGMVIGLALGKIGIGVTLFFGATFTLRQACTGMWWHETLGSVRPLLREFAGLLGWNYLREGMGGVLDAVPLMLVGYYRSPVEVGFYRLAANIVTVGSYVEAELRRVVYPVLSALAASGRISAMRQAVNQWTLLAGCPAAAFLILVILVLPTLLPLMFGHVFDAAVVVTQVMMLGTAFSSILFWVDTWYYAEKKFAFFTQAFMIYVALIIVAIWLCLEVFGLLGLAAILALGKGLFVLTMAGLTFGARARRENDSSG